MENVDMSNGFTAVDSTGAPSCGKTRRFYKDATAGIIGVGDPVIRVTNSSSPDGYPEAVRATTGAAITGVVVGVEITDNLGDLTKTHLAAADSGYLMVACDPMQLFEVQEVSGGTALAVTNIGEHIDAVAALNASTTTGRSLYEIDNAALATDNTFRIEDLSHRVDNEVGEHARWIVSANLHTELNASASSRTEV